MYLVDISAPHPHEYQTTRVNKTTHPNSPLLLHRLPVVPVSPFHSRDKVLGGQDPSLVLLAPYISTAKKNPHFSRSLLQLPTHTCVSTPGIINTKRISPSRLSPQRRQSRLGDIPLHRVTDVAVSHTSSFLIIRQAPPKAECKHSHPTTLSPLRDPALPTNVTAQNRHNNRPPLSVE